VLLAPAARAEDPLGVAASYYEDAAARFERGDSAGAAVQLKNALKAYPRHLPSRVLLGRIHIRLGDGEGAEKELKQARELGADEGLVVLPLGEAYLLQEKYANVLDEVLPSRRYAELESQVLVLRGHAHLGLGQLEDAERAYARAAQTDPLALGPLLGRARVHVARGRLDLAEDFADAATARAPDDATAWGLKAEIRRARDDLDGAVAAYGRAIEANPQALDARLGRASLLADLGRDREAEADLAAVREKVPDHPQAAYLQALLLARAGDMAGAREVFRSTAITLETVRPEVLQRRPVLLLLAGTLNFGNGEMERAAEYLTRYLAIDRGHVGARKLLGVIHLRRGEAEKAVDVLAPGLAVSPKDPQLLALVGQAYMGAKRYALATEMFQKALEVEPARQDLKTQIAVTRFALGQRGEAIRDLESALAEESAGTSRVRQLIAMMQLDNRDYDAALESARALERLDPRNPAAPEIAGRALLGKGDVKAARSHFEKALVLDPDYLQAQLGLAALDLAAGQPDRAKGRYELMLERRPDLVPAMVGIARAAESRGDLEETVRWLEKVRQVKPDAVTEQLHLVDTYLRLDKIDAALQLADELKRAHRGDLRVEEAVGRAQIAKGDREGATKTFRVMYGGALDSPSDLKRIASYQALLEDFEGARWSLDRALAVAPDDLSSVEAMAALDLKAGELDRALARAEDLRARHPELATGDRLLGDALMARQSHAAAAEAYAAAQGKEPSTALAAKLYRARLAAGDAAAALAGLEAWAGAHPQDRQAKRLLAGAYLEGDRIEPSTRLHEALRAELPEDADILNNLAWLYHRQGDPRALETARAAYRITPTNAGVLDTLGWILVEQGEAAEGILYLREAQARTAREPLVRYHLGAALARLGRTDEARRQLEEALRLAPAFRGADEARRLLAEIAGGAAAGTPGEKSPPRAP
jgi:putative PEP-CTERM system TPR-repeat lipoprotein